MSRRNSQISKEIQGNRSKSNSFDEKSSINQANLEAELESKNIDIQINDPSIPLNLNLLGTILSSLIHGISNRPIILPSFRIEELLVIVYQQHFNQPKRQYEPGSNRNTLPSIRSNLPLNNKVGETSGQNNDKSKFLPFINIQSTILPNEYHLIDTILSYYVLCLYFSLNTSYPNGIIHQVIALLQYMHTESLIACLQAGHGPATPHIKIGKFESVFKRNLELDISYKLEIFTEGLQYATWITRQTMRLARILEKIKINNSGFGSIRNQRNSVSNSATGNPTNIPTSLEEVACLHPICIYFMTSFALSHISLMLFHHHLFPLSPGLVEVILVGMLNMTTDRRVNAIKEEEKVENNNNNNNSSNNSTITHNNANSSLANEDPKYYDDLNTARSNNSKLNTGRSNNSKLNTGRLTNFSLNNINNNNNNNGYSDSALNSTREYEDESRMSTARDTARSNAENDTARSVQSESSKKESGESKEKEKLEKEKEKEKQLNPSTIVFNRFNSFLHYCQKLFIFIGHIILDNRTIESVLYTRSRLQKNFNKQLFQFVQHRVSLIREEIENLSSNKSNSNINQYSYSNKPKMSINSKDFHFYRDTNLYIDVVNPPENSNQYLLPNLNNSKNPRSRSNSVIPMYSSHIQNNVDHSPNVKKIVKYEKQYNHYWSIRKSYRHIYLLFSSSFLSLTSGETYSDFFDEDYYIKTYVNQGNSSNSSTIFNTNPEPVLLATNVNKNCPVDEFDSSFQMHHQDYLRSSPFSLNIISTAIKKLEKRNYYYCSNYILSRTLNPLEEIYWILTYLLEYLHKKSSIGGGYWPNLNQEKYAISKQLKNLSLKDNEKEKEKNDNILLKNTKNLSNSINSTTKKDKKSNGKKALNLEQLLSKAKEEATMENRLLKIQDQLNKNDSLNYDSSPSLIAIEAAKTKAFEEQQKVLLETDDQPDTYRFIQTRYTSRPGSRGIKSPLTSSLQNSTRPSLFKTASSSNIVVENTLPPPPPPLPSVVWYCPPLIVVEKQATIFTSQDNTNDFEDPFQNLPSEKDNLEYVTKIAEKKKQLEDEEKAFNQYLEDQQDLIISLNRQHRNLKMRKLRIQKQNELQEKAIRHSQLEEFLKQVQFNEKQEARLRALKEAEDHEKEIERITLLRQNHQFEQENAEFKYLQTIQNHQDAITNIKSSEEAREIIRQQQEEARMKYLEERQRTKEEEKERLLQIKQDEKLQVQFKMREEIEKVRNRLRKGNFISSSTPTLSLPNSEFLPLQINSPNSNPLNTKSFVKNNNLNTTNNKASLLFGKTGYKFYDSVKDESSFSNNYYIQYEDPSTGKPYYYDPSTNTTTYSKPYDLKIRHHIDVEREAYDAEHGEGAYDAYMADIAFKDSVNQNGGYYDEKGVWVWVNGYYDENYNWVENEGYYDENGRFIKYAKVTGDLSFMV